MFFSLSLPKEEGVHLWCDVEPNTQMKFTGVAQTFHSAGGMIGAIREVFKFAQFC